MGNDIVRIQDAEYALRTGYANKTQNRLLSFVAAICLMLLRYIGIASSDF